MDVRARCFSLVMAAGAVLACAAGACAGDAPPTASAGAGGAGGAGPEWPDLATPDAYTLQVQPRFWYVSPAGKLSLPSSTGTAGGYIRTNDLKLDQPRISPFGEVSIKADEWRFTFSGADYNINHFDRAPFAFTLGSTPVAGGASFKMDFDYATYNLSVGYRIVQYDFARAGGDGAVMAGETPDENVLRVEAVGGARLHDVDIRITNAVGNTSGSQQFFGEAFGGARAELQIVRDFSIDLEVTGGGLPGDDHTAYSIDVAVGFSWRPIDAVAAQIGWRQLAFGLEDDTGARKFKYEGTLAGLFVGVVVRF